MAPIPIAADPKVVGGSSEAPALERTKRLCICKSSMLHASLRALVPATSGAEPPGAESFLVATTETSGSLAASRSLASTRPDAASAIVVGALLAVVRAVTR